MTKKDQENLKYTSEKNLKDENYSLRKTILPDFEKFKKMNIITLNPPCITKTHNIQPSSILQNHKKQNTKKLENLFQESDEEDETQENRIKKTLFKIAIDHIDMFQTATHKVVNSKYKKIFEDINEFIIRLDQYTQSFLQSLIINTDQNADIFFENMNIYFGEKGDAKKNEKNSERNFTLNILKESHFYDLKTLFFNLKLYEDIESNDCIMDICNDPNDSKSEQKVKVLPANIIIIREIHLLNPVNFNTFLMKLIDFHLIKNKKFTNIILFDVSYDPKGLFEKIKPNILTKIIFNNLEYISSKTIYKEILYDFVHGRKKISNSGEFSFFIPNSKKTKQIIDYVTTHQISIQSFESYFKFLILEFFIFRKWKKLYFLIYDSDLFEQIKKLNSREKNKSDTCRDDYLPLVKDFFEKNLKSILKTEKIENNQVEDLTDTYLNLKNTREIFMIFYEFFESLINKLNCFNNDYNKFDFFFDFLQFGEDLTKININRTNLICNFLEKKKYFHNIIKNLLIPDLDNLTNSLADESEPKIKILEIKNQFLAVLTKSLINPNVGAREQVIMGRITNNINSKNKIISSIENSQNSVNIDNDQPCLLSDSFLLSEIKRILHEFFGNEFFKDFDNKTNMKILDHNSVTESINNIHSSINNKEYLYNRDYEDYLNFNEVTNPSMNSLFLYEILNMQFILNEKPSRNYKNKNKSIRGNNNMNNLPDNSCKIGDFLVKKTNEKDLEINVEDFWSNLNYSKLFKIFIHVYGSLGFEFKLKFFFTDFLVRFRCDIRNKKETDCMRNIFLKFCHEFYLLGLISRKRPNSEIFVKNFFKMTNYFIKK